VAIGSVNSGTGPASLTVNAGTMTSTVDGRADVVAGALTLRTTSGGSIGTSAALPLEVDVSTLTAQADGTGALNVRDTAGGLTVSSARTANGPINLEAAGPAANLTLTTVVAPGNTVSLRAAGAINGTPGGTADVTAQSLALRAGAGIGVAGPLEVAVANLAFQNAANAVAIRYVGPLTIAPVDGLAGAANAGAPTTLTPVAPPTVTAVVVNGGAAQRSVVTSIQVTFSAAVTVASDAFSLTYLGAPAGTTGGVPGSTVGAFQVTKATVGGVTVVTLSRFFDANTSRGSLIDGRYALTVDRTKVTDVGVAMASDFTFADSGQPGGLYRLFGDANGDRFVNGADFALFRAAFGASTDDPGYNPAFDINGDGTINGADFAAFRRNFGQGI
jgi:hypothetical protein